jgi:NADP-dependent 3-hydroxy acid dehydrogenase YdfG
MSRELFSRVPPIPSPALLFLLEQHEATRHLANEPHQSHDACASSPLTLPLFKEGVARAFAMIQCLHTNPQQLLFLYRFVGRTALRPIKLPYWYFVMVSLLSPIVRRTLLRRSMVPHLATARQRRTLMTLPSFSLEGKTCLVTGAARGLGKEFLTAFALSGARGACVDLSLHAGQSSIKHITEHISSQPSTPSSYTPELQAYACDVTSEEQVQETWESIVKDFGKVDVVVTAAGIVENFEAENYAYDRWKKMLDINLNGSFLFAREAGKYWIDNKMKGNLILVSSMSSIICVRPQKQAAYNAVR